MITPTSCLRMYHTPPNTHLSTHILHASKSPINVFSLSITPPSHALNVHVITSNEMKNGVKNPPKKRGLREEKNSTKTENNTQIRWLYVAPFIKSEKEKINIKNTLRTLYLTYILGITRKRLTVDFSS